MAWRAATGAARSRAEAPAGTRPAQTVIPVGDVAASLRRLWRCVELIEGRRARDERQVMIALFCADLRTVKAEIVRINGHAAPEIHGRYFELAEAASRMVAKDGPGIAPDDEESYRGARGHAEKMAPSNER
jgi:hypothetical protein